MLRLDVQVSPLELILLLLHAAAFGALWLTRLPAPLKLTCGSLILLLAAWHVFRTLVWMPRYAASLYFGRDCVRLVGSRGVRRCRLRRVRACGDQWTLLKFSVDETESLRRHWACSGITVLLLPDSIDPLLHRRLRAHLRFRQEAQAA
ncbi:MAG: hypothetical protein RLZZ385_1367 [Pseudomonadota bacterium]|jgi:hypothetical protein